MERHERAGVRDGRLMLWLRLARVYARVQQATAMHLRDYDLTIAQFDVLAQVGAHEGLTQQELAAALLVTQGNVTQLLDRMQERGLLERRRTPGARGKRVYLTEAGWGLNRRAVPAQEALIRDLFDLDDDDAVVMYRLLRRIERGFDAGDDREVTT